MEVWTRFDLSTLTLSLIFYYFSKLKIEASVEGDSSLFQKPIKKLSKDLLLFGKKPKTLKFYVQFSYLL